jgi:hypothetical protein
MAIIHGSVKGNPNVKQKVPSRNWRRLFFLLLYLCLVLSPLQAEEKTSPASIILNSLSREEKQQIKTFFHNIIARHELGYTLFGDKPMSICWPDTLSPRFSKLDCTFKLYLDGTVPLFKALTVWKKIKQKVQGNNYSLIVCEENKYPSFTILINKKAFSEQFDKNKDLFKKYYSKGITADTIITNLESQHHYSSIFKEPLFCNDVLLGIMLGFGRHSAELFQRRADLMSENVNPPFLHKIKLPSEGFFLVEDELQNITRRFQAKPKQFEWYTHAFPLFLRVTTVTFAFDPDDLEASRLIKKYKDQHAKLTDIFDRNNWLEVVLNKLLQP